LGGEKINNFDDVLMMLRLSALAKLELLPPFQSSEKFAQIKIRV
jgi:hypothetical protein